ncbi:MAG: thiamine pyrophosphate-binding protein [Rickettsiales bacterium]|nr:thiamine pyrophosphate-binding protein [Rickettsiales bacterium]
MVVADMILSMLEWEGVTDFFGYPGTPILPIYNSLRSSRIKHHLPRHEQNAIFAAMGYSKISGRVPVVLVTPGPGVANIVGGLLSSQLELLPVLVITASIANSQNYRYKISNLSEIAAVFSTKVYKLNSLGDVMVAFSDIFKDIKDRYTVSGPFSIEICQRLLLQEVKNSDHLLRSYKLLSLAKRVGVFRKNLKIAVDFPSSWDFKNFINLFNSSKRPVILLGRGAVDSGAYRIVRQLSKKFRIPVVHSLLATGALDRDDVYNFGLLGLCGDRRSYNVVKHCDLLVIVGAKCHPRTIGPLENFAPRALIARVDLDEYKFRFSVDIRADLNIGCDSALFCKNWLSSVADGYVNSHSLPKLRPAAPSSGGGPGGLAIEYFFSVLNGITAGKIPVATGIGQNSIFALKFYSPEDPRSFLVSPDFAAMGFGLPAAIGASIATARGPVIVIDGDGSFQMSMQELATLAELDLPILICILNNRCLGLIKENERRMFGPGPFFVGLKNPDFVRLASAFGIEAGSISSDGEVESTLTSVFGRRRPYLLEVKLSSNHSTVGNHVKFNRKL